MYSRFTSENMGMRAAMLTYAIALIVFGLIALFMMEKNEVEGRVDAKQAFKGLLKVCTLPKVWIAGFIVWMGYAAYNGLSYYSPYLVEILGMSATTASFISIIRTYLFAVVVAPLAGSLADKMGSRIRFLQYVFAIGGVAMAATILLSIINAPTLVCTLRAHGHHPSVNSSPRRICKPPSAWWRFLPRLRLHWAVPQALRVQIQLCNPP